MHTHTCLVRCAMLCFIMPHTCTTTTTTTTLWYTCLNTCVSCSIMITSIPPRNASHTHMHKRYINRIYNIARADRLIHAREREREIRWISCLNVFFFFFFFFIFCTFSFFVVAVFIWCLLFFLLFSVRFSSLARLSVCKSCIIHLYCVCIISRTGTDKSSTKQPKKQRRQQLQQQKTINDERQAKFIAEDREKIATAAAATIH